MNQVFSSSSRSTAKPEEHLAGVVERVTFHSIESGWSVLKVTPVKRSHDLVSVVIHQAQVFAGATMDFYGEWVQHPKYGRQFRAVRAVERKPASAAAIEKYLGSGLIKGVGPATAHKIVKHFGERTLEVFENRIEELIRVPTISKKKLELIRESWKEHQAIRDVMIFLQSHGVSTLFAVKIYKQYGDRSIAVVSENPYQLAKDIFGIGFFSADRIALSLGFEMKGLPRVKAGVKHVLAGSRDEGHCYLTKPQIIDKSNRLLQMNEPGLVEQALIELIEGNEIKKRELETGEGPLECYYANSLYWDEFFVAQKISELIGQRISLDREAATKWLMADGRSRGFSLSEEQGASVLGIIERSFAILTGGPGCGKTTTTKALVSLLNHLKKRVLLAAPTGRAAQRMSEVIGCEAKTIHRLLEWDPYRGGFKRSASEPLEGDYLILDECSMLDISLAAAIMRAVPKGCQVLFIGDPDQLPSVGAGAVLSDLLRLPKVPQFRLTKIFRQAEKSLIIQYAHTMNRGTVPQIPSPLADGSLWKSGADCLFIDAEEATAEQMKFVTRAKAVISKTLREGRSHQIRSEDRNLGQMVPKGDRIKVEAASVLSQEPSLSQELSQVDDLTFIIPKKFEFVDLEALSLSSNEVDELKEVIQKIHPWSALHYGYTALEIVKRLYSKTVKEQLGKECEVQILTPQIRGTLGAMNLNQSIQELVNPAHPMKGYFRLGDRIYRQGDRVIQTRNNYDLNVFNGDIGRIVAIDSEEEVCNIEFDEDRTVTYQREDLNEISLAYAITIHKSQGSEFDAVIIPVTSQHFRMLFRNLIYTGLTRAKKLAVFVGSRRAMAMAIGNQDQRQRQTALCELMENFDR